MAIDDTGIDSWEIKITNIKNKVVKTIKKQGIPPSSVEWNGKDDHYEEVVPSGNYNVIFTVIDEVGNKKITEPQTITVK